MSIDLEICVDSVESVLAAARAGAKCIELCSALSEGGITPSVGLISMVREAVPIQLHVIIRPRGGNFVYTDSDLAVMKRDIASVKTLGADGIVFGVLNPDATVNRAHTTELVELAHPLQVTFHRAFDMCSNAEAALEDVIACRAHRLLTAGGRSDAIHNLATMARLQRMAAGRIRIMAGGGIRIGNVHEIVTHTGIRAVHTSLNTKGRTPVCDSSDDTTDFERGIFYVVQENDVRAFKSMLHAIDVETQGKPAHGNPSKI